MTIIIEYPFFLQVLLQNGLGRLSTLIDTNFWSSGFLNHLKSKLVFEKKDVAKRAMEEKEANKLRESQAKKVAEFVRKRFSGDLFDTEDFVVVGDFNATPDSPHLKKLVKELGMVDVISSSFTKKEDKWTYYWASENAITQIDYILLSPHLAKNSTKLPHIERRGISNAKV
ncbi:MAG TPA: endonuclease/exonuclease/phosphatase family protein [Nitrososphaeraceae archaeon]|nr:endonuclease/exonuclease/phosphatase family protein [Nitrososphaeraceae archaeon]